METNTAKLQQAMGIEGQRMSLVCLGRWIKLYRWQCLKMIGAKAYLPAKKKGNI